jgi:hypothetical protein
MQARQDQFQQQQLETQQQLLGFMQLVLTATGIAPH